MKFYTDADWASNVLNWKSTSGYVFLMQGSATCWASKRQKTVPLSTMEAEYAAMVEAICQWLWQEQWFTELGVKVDRPFTLLSDNQAAIALTKNPEHHGRAKHIDIRMLFIRDMIEAKSVAVEYVASADNLADIFTKALPNDAFLAQRKRVMGS